MWVVIAGYSFCLLAAIISCIAIIRSRHAGVALWWLVCGLISGLASIVLFVSKGYAPVFFSVVLANLGLLVVFAFIHQAIASIVDRSRRYVELSTFLIVAQFVATLYFTYSLPDVRWRLIVRTWAILTQVVASILVLLRQKPSSLRDPIRALVLVLVAFSTLQLCRLPATVIWTPIADPLHPDPVQAFFSLFGCILGLGICFGVIWLGLYAHRNYLHTMANTDGLSGLLNRRAFDVALDYELRWHRDDSQPLALLLIDLDHFKAINDMHGHHTGDEVIRRVSHLLRANSRPVDSVARYGGEEFAVILKGMDLHQAKSVAERLRREIEGMVNLPESIGVTVSIGVAMKTRDDTVASLVKRSDEALYLAKRSGRNRVSTQDAHAKQPPTVIYT
jgi:diguanylate cyclase (GGDEF)-like protein